MPFEVTPIRLSLELSPDALFEVGVPEDDVRLIKQDGQKLCWAACVVSTIKSLKLDEPWTQLSLARRFLSCDPDGRLYSSTLENSPCDQLITEEQVPDVWEGVRFDRPQFVSLPRGDQTLGELLQENLSPRSPVQLYVDGGRHVVMIFRYRKRANDEEEVLLMDPLRSGGWYELSSSDKWVGAWTQIRRDEGQNAAL